MQAANLISSGPKFPPNSPNPLLIKLPLSPLFSPYTSLFFFFFFFFLQMGTCFSSTDTDSFSCAALTATVISVNGALHRYPLPVNASQVLGLHTTSPSSFFLCNSDHLFFDEYIPPLDSTQQLDVGQIYFLLPISRLQYPLAAREMAAMAVKASMALVDGSKKEKKYGKFPRRNRTQVSPLSDLGEKVLEDEDEGKTTKRYKKLESDVVGIGQKSKSLKRVMSRKGKLGQWQRPFRATLSTIHE